MTDIESRDVKLDYAPPPVRRRGGELGRFALFISLVALSCLVVSVPLYVFVGTGAGMLAPLRLIQGTLALTSIATGLLALVLAPVALILNRRGRREIVALAVAVLHAVLCVAAMTYLG